MTAAIPPTAAATFPTRYHPAQVSMHWLIAILVFITPLLVGDAEGSASRLAAAGGIPLIGFHMLFGLSVLALLAIRLLIRWAIRRPQWATAGNRLFDWVGRATHFGLYLFAFAVTITGLTVALQTNRLAAAFGGASAGQPAPGIQQPGQVAPGGTQVEGGEGSGRFAGGIGGIGRSIVRAFHELSWQLLLVLIILHVGAALYHQFILKDHLMSRMWFGART